MMRSGERNKSGWVDQDRILSKAVVHVTLIVSITGPSSLYGPPYSLTSMSLSSTSNLKQQLTKNLGDHAQNYFQTLNNFVSGKLSRTEFEETAKQLLNTPTLRV